MNFVLLISSKCGHHIRELPNVSCRIVEHEGPIRLIKNRAETQLFHLKRERGGILTLCLFSPLRIICTDDRFSG